MSDPNTAAKARRSWNENLRHYQELHSMDREFSTSEVTRMLKAAKKNPHGHAAKMIKELQERAARGQTNGG